MSEDTPIGIFSRRRSQESKRGIVTRYSPGLSILLPNGSVNSTEKFPGGLQI